MKAEWEEGQSGSLLQEEAPAEETRKTEAVSAQAAPAAIVEDSGREAAEREEYWNSVLTGMWRPSPGRCGVRRRPCHAPGMAWASGWPPA